MSGKSDREDLRQKAERLYEKKLSDLRSQPSESEIRKLVHELEVHQIELEMQNEELKLARLQNETITEKYIELYDFAPTGYFTLSDSGKILELNLTAALMLVKDRSQLINCQFDLFLSTESNQIFNKFLEDIFKSKGKETCELTISFNNNLPIYIFLTGIIIGNGEQCIINAIDITERKRAEFKITKLNEELEAFIHAVSHDLKAPLRHTSGYVNLLNNNLKAKLSEKEIHFLKAIDESVGKMGELIDELLLFSRTGYIKMSEESIDMKLMVTEIVDQLKLENTNRSIEWVIEKLPSAICDEAMIKVVWMNLLSNALKYTRSKDKVVIEIGSIEGDSETIFYVSDNGIGFDEQYAHQLFGIFQRLHTPGEYEGTGLGLANVNRIILRHGGRVWAETEKDKGAKFYFSIPK